MDLELTCHLTHGLDWVPLELGLDLGHVGLCPCCPPLSLHWNPVRQSSFVKFFKLIINCALGHSQLLADVRNADSCIMYDHDGLALIHVACKWVGLHQ